MRPIATLTILTALGLAATGCGTATETAPAAAPPASAPASTAPAPTPSEVRTEAGTQEVEGEERDPDELLARHGVDEDELPDVPPAPEDPEEPAGFDVEGDTAYMVGVIDTDFDLVVLSLLFEYPEVDTIAMIEVPGSDDDDSNLAAARIVRDEGLTTWLFADSSVASGGTDFFLAGQERVLEAGAEVGVHSWAGGEGERGDELPRDHPEHTRYLEYYEEMGIDEDFYWFTLEAAAPEDMYTMSLEEIERFGLATEIR